MIERSLIKSFPESDYARANGYSPGGYSPTNLTRKELAENVLEELGISSLKGVPGAYFKENDNGKGYWTFSGASGLLLPVFNHKGRGVPAAHTDGLHGDKEMQPCKRYCCIY